MLPWNLQKKANVPLSAGASNVADLPGMTSTSKPPLPPFAVTECSSLPSLVTVTVPPGAAGPLTVKVKPVMPIAAALAAGDVVAFGVAEAAADVDADGVADVAGVLELVDVALG